MANRRKNSRYNDGGFDMKSLGALLVILIGVALIIILVKSTENGGGMQEAGSSGNPSAVTSDISDETGNTVSEPNYGDNSQEDDPLESDPLESDPTESEPEFTVTVTGLDGTYNRTNVESAKSAKLKVVNQDNESFEFTLSLPEGNYAGVAEFVGETTAQWEYDGSVLKFECGNGTVTLSGLKAANGKYITGEPTYTDEKKSNYDANIINSSSVRSNLSGIMSSNDYSLLKSILSEGDNIGISQNSSEYQTDKNGTGIMVDKETGMIKYQYQLKYEGKCMVLCSADGNVCVGIYNENDDTGELRYYASTSSLRSNVPTCIRNYAVAHKLDLVNG